MNEEFAAKKTPVEDLTIPTTDLNPSPIAAQAEDWGMTSPLSKPSSAPQSGDDWRMPEPIFRASEGFCPLKSDGKTRAKTTSPEMSVPPMPSPDSFGESLANLYAPPENDAAQRTMHNLSLSDLQLSASDLEPVAPAAAAAQPSISQEYTIKPPPADDAAEPAEKARSETARLIFAALGVLAMLGFAAGFLALVYFLFFYKAVE